MDNNILEIRNLSVSVKEVPILKGLNLTIPYGAVHAIMGPNGAGKSTLAQVLSGHPSFSVTGGEIFFKGQNLLEKKPEERAHLGLFLSFQTPPEIAGVTNLHFLEEIILAKRRQSPTSRKEIDQSIHETAGRLQMREECVDRSLNVGFSGGEKKRNEILQMLLLQPDLVVLDEIDSGLDVDAIRIISEEINRYRSKERSFLIITHYPRLLESIRPDVVHVLSQGRIVHSGEESLAQVIDEKGYEWL